jgi:DNA-binding MarR family transcriptional regulator
MKSAKGSRSRHPPADRATVARLVDLSLAVMERYFATIQSVAPDPRLSYQRFRALSWIDSSSPVTVGDMASSMGIARSTASEMIARLVQDGLVAKSSGSNDGRSVQVVLTPLAQRLVQRRRKDLWEAHERLINSVAPHDRDDFVQAFETMHRVLR